MSLGMLRSIDRLGANIPKSDLVSDYIFAVVWAVILGASILLWPVPLVQKCDLLICWLCRMATALGFMLLVESWYPGSDAYDYFLWANAESFHWTGFRLGEGNENVTTLVWLQDLIFPSSFHALKVTWSFVGMLAAFLFYRAVVLILGREDRRLFFLLSLMPSILYWSSIVGKDPISLLGMGLYAYGVISAYTKRAPQFLLVAILGILIVSYIRSWYGPMMIAPLLAFVFAPISRPTRKGIVVRVGGLAGLVIGFVMFWTNSKFSESFTSTEVLLQTTTTINASFATGGSATEATQFTSVGTLLVNLPFGIFTALLRPLPGEIMAPFGLMAGVENLLMIAWVGLLTITVRKRHFQDPIVLWLLIFTLLWATQYGLTTAGNLGSLVRYRLQVLPILVTLLILLSAPPRLETSHSRRRVVRSTSPRTPRQLVNHPMEQTRPSRPAALGSAQSVGME